MSENLYEDNYSSKSGKKQSKFNTNLINLLKCD